MRLKLISICLFLALVTLVAYWPVTGNLFVAYDDQLYITANQNVMAGLSLNGLVWAFSTFDVANWHPVTWLSHQLDVTIFGLDPGYHHLVSLLLHAANSILLLALLNRLTGSLWRSTFVAALFALHPQRVESVAWAAERKDLLCAFFFFLALHAYIRSIRRERWQAHLPVVILFALSLMSKPMSVTLPFVLLLLDWWPLRRLGTVPLRTIFLEKMPLMLLSGISCIITVYAQKAGEAVISIERLSLFERTTNALTSYATYLYQALWPVDLAILYPLPSSSQYHMAALSAMAIAVAAAGAVKLRKTRPYLLFGLMWYLGMLVPVIGLVQVGVQSHADRYTYLPLIGCYITVAWGLHDIAVRVQWAQRILPPLAAGILLVLAIRTYQLTTIWHSSETLFRHALAVTGNNYVMHTNLGIALLKNNRQEEAIAEFRKGIAICPEYSDQHFILGNALLEYGDTRGAIAEYRTTLKFRPDYPHVYTNLGMALEKAGDAAGAIAAYKEGLKIDPADYKARENLQILLN